MRRDTVEKIAELIQKEDSKNEQHDDVPTNYEVLRIYILSTDSSFIMSCSSIDTLFCCCFFFFPDGWSRTVISIDHHGLFTCATTVHLHGDGPLGSMFRVSVTVPADTA